MRTENLNSILARFPQYELDIRRRCACDEGFRSICTDYQEASAALRYWQNSCEKGNQNALYYESFVRELETEIFAVLGVRMTCS